MLNDCNPSFDNNQQSSRLPASITSALVTAAVSLAATSSTSISPTAASARAIRDSRKKQQKVARENRWETSGQDSVLRNGKADLSKNHISQALQVTTLLETVITVTATNSLPSTAIMQQVTSSLGQQGVQMSSFSKPAVNTNSNNPVPASVLDTTNNKENCTYASVNGGGTKARSKKSSDIIKQSSSTGKILSLALCRY